MARVVDKWWRSIRNGISYYVVGLFERIGEHHAFLMSGGLAFSLFICSIPLLLVVFAALSYVLDSPAVIAEINTAVDRVMPYPEYAASLKDFIGERLTRTSDLKQVAGIIGVIGLLFASSGLFSSLRTILNTVFKAEKTESVLVGKLWDFTLVLLVLMLFIVLIMALPFYEAFTELADDVTWLNQATLSFAQGVGVWLVSFTILVIAFSSIYWLVPWRRPDRRTTLISALAAAILWSLAQELFGFYVSHMATLKHIYGVYSFLIVAAFWIYYSALVLIVAAEIGQLSAERRDMVSSSIRGHA